MKILIACECSGRVRDAFIAMGHDAMSCDLEPSDTPGPHYQGDVFDVIDDGWDMMIAHPPCTFLTCCAEWAYKDVQTKKLKPGTLFGAERRQARVEAVEFVRRLANARIDRIAIENPVGVLSRQWKAPDQRIQPYDFGEDASKRTCLWLKNLPLLEPTSDFPPRYVCCGEVLDVETLGMHGCWICLGERRPLPRWGNQTDSGQNRETPSENRAKIRSITYQGWADAMANQWGELSEDVLTNTSIDQYDDWWQPST